MYLFHNAITHQPIICTIKEIFFVKLTSYSGATIQDSFFITNLCKFKVGNEISNLELLHKVCNRKC